MAKTYSAIFDFQLGSDAKKVTINNVASDITKQQLQAFGDGYTSIYDADGNLEFKKASIRTVETVEVYPGV